MSSENAAFDAGEALHRALGYEGVKKSGDHAWIEGEKSPYQGHDITHFPDWRNLIVWDAFFNNMTSGLMIITGILWAFGTPAFTFIMPVALSIALILVGIDFIILIADLGDSWRFPHSLRVLHFTSPLSVGVWGLVGYAACLAVGVVFYWLGIACMNTAADGLGRAFLLTAKPFTVLAFIGAVVVICYKGVVFSCTSQPGVKHARWLSSWMVSDALLLGLGVYTFISVCMFGMQAGIWLVLPYYILLCARCIAFALVWLDVRHRARRIYSDAGNFWTAIAVFLGGGVLPALCALFGGFGLLCAAILVLACGILERYWLIGLARPL